ncbi:hypothetical protein ACSBR1_034797 [Camellia fascicularis]
MLVASAGMRTDLGKLMATLHQSGENETPLQVKLNGIATIAGKICLTVSILTFLVLTARLMVGKALCNEFLEWSRSDALKLLIYIAVAVTVLMVGVPQGVPLAVTLSLAFSARKLMNERVFLKHLSPCETMASVSSICTDKTGTLTTNRMVVDRLFICSEVISSKDAVNFLKSAKHKGVLDILLQSIYLNCGSEVPEIEQGKGGKNTFFGSPTELALLEFAFLFGGHFIGKCQHFKILQEMNFNSFIKKRSVHVACPEGGIRAFCTGAAEIILNGCNKIVCSNGESVHFSEEQKENILDIIKRFCCGALRTLCLAFKDINDSSDCIVPDDDYTLIAIVGISDPLRLEVKNVVQTCLAAGITVCMVTGDNINTANAVAKECGILTDYGLAIEGPDFRSKSPEELEELIPNFQVAREAADVVLMDDNFATIVNLVKWGRSVYQNVQQFVQLQLTINNVVVVFNFVSACFSGSAPLTAVQLVFYHWSQNFLYLSIGYPFRTQIRWQEASETCGEDAGCLLDTVIFNSFVLFQVVVVEFLGSFAHTKPLRWQLWFISILIGFVSIYPSKHVGTIKMSIAVSLKCIYPSKHEGTIKMSTQTPSMLTSHSATKDCRDSQECSGSQLRKRK